MAATLLSPKFFVPTVFLFAVVSGASITVLAACSDDTESPADADGGQFLDANTPPKKDGESSSGGDSGGSGFDAAPAKNQCEAKKTYVLGCGGTTTDLNCTTNFDTWCQQNDTAINSEAFRRAELACLTAANCEKKAKDECEYKFHNKDTLSAAASALAGAFCQTCEPDDVNGCITRSTKYDPARGTDSIGDIYIAVWELNDALNDSIRAKCTGTPVSDAGADADAGDADAATLIDAGADDGGAVAACTKKFGGCSADIYLNAVPDCPK